MNKNDQEIKAQLQKIVNQNKNITYSEAFLLKSGSYFQTTIEIAVSPNMQVKDLIKAEVKIKQAIKKLPYHIKFIDFDIVSL